MFELGGMPNAPKSYRAHLNQLFSPLAAVRYAATEASSTGEGPRAEIGQQRRCTRESF